jgi:hypothetical protein
MRITIQRRVCGPPESGNGGYTAGLLATLIPGAVEVTLRRPPPLERPLGIEAGDVVRLHDGDDLVAEARSVDLDLDVPPPPTFAVAQDMSRAFPSFDEHAFPTCFVCGPKRSHGDGLRIFAGSPCGGSGVVAAPWTPDASLADDDGVVRREFLWAALDCPGYFAVADPPERALLGRMSAEVDDGLTAGTRCVVTAWSLGREGRKLRAGVALFDAAGALRGRAVQTWLTI